MVYSYKHSFSGFSALLNSTQASTLADTEGVISVFKSKTLKLHTTRSWDFMGLTLDKSNDQLTQSTPLQLAHGDDVIVGIFDTGIWPESDSFREEGCMGRIPRHWKGKCEAGEGFEPATACNRKLIGARYYVEGFERKYGALNASRYPEHRSPRDSLGHGTHTASTAVGSVVEGASFLGGLGRGRARGGAPRARLAVYKVCWNYRFDGKCSEADVMAAFDDALHDGVHVISASFGARPPLPPFFAWSAGIGSFHAMQRGVSVVFSAGNSGPDPSLVTNVAPWSICVAASSIDRAFPTPILLDDANLTVTGQSFNAENINAKLADASLYFNDGVCEAEKLNRSAQGRVVLCFSTVGGVTSEDAARAAWKANASALIFASPLTQQIAEVYILPVVHVDIDQGTKLQHYFIQSFRLPRVQILASSTVIKKSPAPVVAPYSSRGPSSISPDILKPDISAPGVNILAAWARGTPPTLSPDDRRSVEWNFQSGTSMSCPHVAGAVALLKSAHPDWSPAAIKSALMTTAYTKDTTRDAILAGGSMETADPLDIGAGHMDPVKAMDPGLVYDTRSGDYVLFLCNLGYTGDQIKRMTRAHDICPESKSRLRNADMNYPSIAVWNLQSTVTVKRTVKNVGKNRAAVYLVRVVSPDGVEVVVWPRLLIFSCFAQQLSYHVTLRPLKVSRARIDFGEIVWSDGFHRVRSPLLVLLNTSTHSVTTAAT